MKLIQVIHDDNGKHYVYKCPTCGLVITSDRVVTTCLVCREWAEDVAEETEETNDRTDNNRMSPN